MEIQAMEDQTMENYGNLTENQLKDLEIMSGCFRSTTKENLTAERTIWAHFLKSTDANQYYNAFVRLAEAGMFQGCTWNLSELAPNVPGNLIENLAKYVKEHQDQFTTVTGNVRVMAAFYLDENARLRPNVKFPTDEIYLNLVDSDFESFCNLAKAKFFTKTPKVILSGEKLTDYKMNLRDNALDKFAIYIYAHSNIVSGRIKYERELTLPTVEACNKLHKTILDVIAFEGNSPAGRGVNRYLIDEVLSYDEAEFEQITG